ncbi:MAG TPA: transcriptional repressor [Thermoanaerobaculales bacterium]|nr:transcriptional repressor [Thermoanaerobaculales bacterium]HPA80967.1 transcriptional repressor [Thermoanaerobaculales bacterium]HQL31596.1 transcriptional repressor [Thermoanaerobaculales bacterium]HQN94925.1 transcriptional repressor [Thermoanaerobaculales bacterium]
MAQRPRTRDTRQRRLVYEAIRATTSHPTADWIFDRVRVTMPKISLGTVYRNLSVLRDEGLVREIFGTDRRAHYDANTRQHAHFICSECGAITDLHGIPEYEWRTLKELVGCEVTELRIEFAGVCATCRHRCEDPS